MTVKELIEKLKEFPHAGLSAAIFWKKRKNLNIYADQDNIKAVTKIVNGGFNGLNDTYKNGKLFSIGRTTYLHRAKEGLKNVS